MSRAYPDLEGTELFENFSSEHLFKGLLGQIYKETHIIPGSWQGTPA